MKPFAFFRRLFGSGKSKAAGPSVGAARLESVIGGDRAARAANALRAEAHRIAQEQARAETQATAEEQTRIELGKTHEERLEQEIRRLSEPGIPSPDELGEPGDQSTKPLGDRPEPQLPGWIPASSSNVDSFRWVPAGSYDSYMADVPELHVRFWNAQTQNCSEYIYYGVNEDQYDDFFTASSFGEWVWDHLINAGVLYHCVAKSGMPSIGDLLPWPRPGSRKLGVKGWHRQPSQGGPGTGIAGTGQRFAYNQPRRQKRK